MPLSFRGNAPEAQRALGSLLVPCRWAGGVAAVIGLGDVVMILELRRQGLSISAIAREVGLDRKTIRRYLARGLEPPAYGPRQPRPTLLDPFTG